MALISATLQLAVSALATSGRARALVIPPPPIPQSPLTFAVLGDSWASGVAYLAANEYDGNADGCLRITEAYAVQMQEDNTWSTSSSLQFPACSGSRLVDIIGDTGRKQLLDSGMPDLIIMTNGGNNAEFFNVASNCIYQQSPLTNYGPAFDDDPEKVGMCAGAIQSATNYLSDDESGFLFDLQTTYKQILETDLLIANPNMRIYHTGYAHFFNEDEDWCDSDSFGVTLLNQSLLTKTLRSAINQLTQTVNDKISQAISDLNNPNWGFIDLSTGFDGHRFCEAGMNHNDQYYSPDVWFWNLSPPLPAQASNSLLSTNVTLDGFTLDGAIFTGGDPQLGPDSGHGDTSRGWQMRPFHPKQVGHQSIKNTIIQKLRDDNVPGVKP